MFAIRLRTFLPFAESVPEPLNAESICLATASFNTLLEMPGLLAFSSFELLNVIDGISAEEAACCVSILWMTCLYVHRCGGASAGLGVEVPLGVGPQRVSARRFICGTSALHNKHGGGAERLNKDKAHAARRFINAEIYIDYIYRRVPPPAVSTAGGLCAVD